MRLRVSNRELPPAGELLETAKLFGLDGELAWEVIKQVSATLGGPSFVTRSLRLQKISGNSARVVEATRLYGTGSSGERVKAANEEEIGQRFVGDSKARRCTVMRRTFQSHG